jgi:hypothetical protein
MSLFQRKCPRIRFVCLNAAEFDFSSRCTSMQEELVECRLDHYQTPSTVQVSIYAKKADKSRSIIQFSEQSVRYSSSSFAVT